MLTTTYPVKFKKKTGGGGNFCHSLPSHSSLPFLPPFMRCFAFSKMMGREELQIPLGRKEGRKNKERKKKVGFRV